MGACGRTHEAHTEVYCYIGFTHPTYDIAGGDGLLNIVSTLFLVDALVHEFLFHLANNVFSVKQ